MDIQAPRPAVGTSISPQLRPEPEQVRQSVRTELPTPRSVAAAGPSEHAATTRHSTDNAFAREAEQRRAQLQRLADQMREQYEHKVIVDDKSGDTVFRTIDPNTKRVVNQFPNDLVLKLRSYVQGKEPRSDASSAQPPQQAPEKGNHSVSRVA